MGRTRRGQQFGHAKRPLGAEVGVTESQLLLGLALLQRWDWPAVLLSVVARGRPDGEPFLLDPDPDLAPLAQQSLSLEGVVQQPGRLLGRPKNAVAHAGALSWDCSSPADPTARSPSHVR